MKRKLLFFFLLCLALSVPAFADDMVVNQTTCNTMDNSGTALNIYGNGFLFNYSASNTSLKLANLEVLNLVNVTGAVIPAGTIFDWRIHYNESVANSTVICTQTFTPSIANSGMACGNGLTFNVTFSSCTLNKTGNYTWSMEIRNEGATAQFGIPRATSNPYVDGKCYGCAGVAGFAAMDDTKFRIWVENATPSVSYFQITARNVYDNVSITNFNASVTAPNGTTSTYGTTNGTIVTTVVSNTGLINVSVNSSYHFNSSYQNYNSSSHLLANLTQAQLNLYVRNAVTSALISSFTVTTNKLTHSGTNGFIVLNFTNTSQTINISASGYQTKNATYNFSSLDNITSTVYLSPILGFNLYNETGGGPFHPNASNGVTLRIFCSNETIEQSITANTTNVTATCAWDFMRMYVTFGNDTYFRTLIPSYSVSSVNWYLINLNIDTAVQKTFTLDDLASQFSNGTLIVEKIIGASQVRIHEEQWDIENKVQAYFILNDLYILSLTDNNNVTRVLGPFLADSTTSHTITVPIIEFNPDNEIDDFLYGYDINQEAGWLYMSYESTAGTLVSVNWAIVNASNPSQVFLNTTFLTATGTANYTSLINGTIYKSTLTFNHSSFSVHSDVKNWGAAALSELTLPGFSDPAKFKKWFSVVAIIVVTLGFSGLSVAAGALTFCVFTWFFVSVQWLNLSVGSVPGGVVFGIFVVIAIGIIMVAEGIR